jgi:glycosyltransferase involved in cell wall biosynthesis
MYGDALPEGLGRNGEISTAELEVDGVLMARAAIDAATRFFVFSRTAFGLATIDAGRADRGQITALPFGIARPNAAAPFLAEGQRPPTSAPSEALGRWEDRRGRQEGSLVAAFGIVDRSKLPGLLVDAVGSLSARVPDIELAFVGPISQLLTEELADAAARVDLGDRLTITGPLGPGEYRRWMEATTVAVQLRPSSNGEASATIGECLALGIPTIASATGWAAELPEGTVELVDRNLDATELAARLDTVLGDLGIRHSLAESGQKYAADNTFDRAARELLAAVGVPDAAAAQRFS